MPKNNWEKKFDEKEWLENMLFLIGKDFKKWEALLVLIEYKIRYKLTQQRKEFLEIVGKDKKLLPMKKFDVLTNTINAGREGENLTKQEIRTKMKEKYVTK